MFSLYVFFLHFTLICHYPDNFPYYISFIFETIHLYYIILIPLYTPPQSYYMYTPPPKFYLKKNTNVCIIINLINIIWIYSQFHVHCVIYSLSKWGKNICHGLPKPVGKIHMACLPFLLFRGQSLLIRWAGARKKYRRTQDYTFDPPTHLKN